MNFKKIKYVLFTLLLFLFACSNNDVNLPLENNSYLETELTNSYSKEIIEDTFYYEKEEVSEYIKKYNKLPPNYITKDEANKIGWSVEDNDGLVIGGDRFGNREKKLPYKKGREYYEADLIQGYSHHRGPVRLVYSNDGLIFYTDDHYETFEELK